MCVCVCVCVYLFMSWIQVTPGVTLNNFTPSNNLLLNSYFENLIVGLHYFCIFSMFAKF